MAARAHKKDDGVPLRERIRRGSEPIPVTIVEFTGHLMIAGLGAGRWDQFNRCSVCAANGQRKDGSARYRKPATPGSSNLNAAPLRSFSSLRNMG